MLIDLNKVQNVDNKRLFSNSTIHSDVVSVVFNVFGNVVLAGEKKTKVNHAICINCSTIYMVCGRHMSYERWLCVILCNLLPKRACGEWRTVSVLWHTVTMLIYGIPLLLSV